MWLSLTFASPMTAGEFGVGTAGILPWTWAGASCGPHQDPALEWQRAEATAKVPPLPPCSPALHNFQARSAVSAKVDLVSINKGIIAWETWLQDGPYPITAVAGLQQPLPCNYPTTRRCGAALCILFLVTEPQARSGGSLQPKIPGWGMQKLRWGQQSHLGVTHRWRSQWGSNIGTTSPLPRRMWPGGWQQGNALFCPCPKPNGVGGSW